MSRAQRMVCAVQRFRFETLRELSATHIAYERRTVFYSSGVAQRLGTGALIQRSPRQALQQLAAIPTTQRER